MPRLRHEHDWIWSCGWYVCLDCGHSYKETALPIDGHDAIWFRRTTRPERPLAILAPVPLHPPEMGDLPDNQEGRVGGQDPCLQEAA